MVLCHINYGLRGEDSEGDQEFISRLGRAYGVEVFLRKITDEERGSRQGEGIQEWARRHRQTEFSRLAAAGWTIALAHHEGDVAENVLLRMARGASPGHLGIRSIDLPYWRPLLRQNKAELAAFMAAHEFEHRHDGSNDKLDYSRNVIRHKVLPELEALFPGAASRIAACAEEAADVSAHCRDALMAEIATMTPAETRTRLVGLPKGLARAGLAGLISMRAPGFRQLSRSWLDAILDRAASPDEGRYGRDIPGGGRVLIEQSGIVIEPSHTVIMSSESV